MPMTQYLRKKLGDHAIGKAAFTMPTNVFVGLFVSSPTDSGSQANEVTGGSYARINITSLMNAFDSSTGIAVNSADINFADPTATWGLIAAVGILDSLTVGNMLFFENTPNPRTIISGSRHVQFAAGQLIIQFI